MSAKTYFDLAPARVAIEGMTAFHTLTCRGKHRWHN